MHNGDVKTDTSDIGSAQEEEQELLSCDQKQAEEKQQISAAQRVRSCLAFLSSNLNNVGALVCLWLAMLLISIALSLMSPIFPQKVCYVAKYGNDPCGQVNLGDPVYLSS